MEVMLEQLGTSVDKSFLEQGMSLLDMVLLKSSCHWEGRDQDFTRAVLDISEEEGVVAQQEKGSKVRENPRQRKGRLKGGWGRCPASFIEGGWGRCPASFIKRGWSRCPARFIEGGRGSCPTRFV